MGTKIGLKKVIGDEHGYECYICGREITEEEIEKGLIDTDRLIPKAEGQGYEIDITRLACPQCHMKRHGTHRIRPEDLGLLKIAIDDREQWLKLKNKIENQLRAYSRQTDEYSEITKYQLEEMLPGLKEKLAQRTKLIEAWIKEHKEEGIIKSALNVKGLAALTIAYFVTYFVPEKAKHRSSFWKYIGLDRPSHERYTKGETSGGNKRLRTAVWRCIDSMWKNRDCPYREIGDRVKERLSISEKVVSSRNTKGILVTLPWKETKKCHRHGAAYRKMMKELVGDYWVVARKFLGLPTDNTYAVDMLGHEQQTDPRDRGWLFPDEAQRASQTYRENQCEKASHGNRENHIAQACH